MKDVYVDKVANMNVIGALMKDTTLLEQAGRYPICVDDFVGRFEQSIFIAINNLYANKVRKISVVEIDTYLVKAPNIYKVFTEGNGIDYLNDALKIANTDNFEYYYSRMKKFHGLRQLEKMGVSCEKYYPKDVIVNPAKRIEIEEKFDTYQISDIFNDVVSSVLLASRDFSIGGEQGGPINENMRELIEQLKEDPMVGPSLKGDLYNAIVRGARKGTLFINSGSTGSGKSRRMVANACHLAFPYRYNPLLQKWEETGNCEKVLLITTELKTHEIQTMVLAYLTGINERFIKEGLYNKKEKVVLQQALALIDEFGSKNLFLERFPDPTRGGVVGAIRQYSLIEEVEYVFFDYIFASPGLLNEFRDLKLRTDQVLGIFATSLKEVADELNIYLETATQLSGSFYEEQDGIKNEQFLRGAKNISDKADIGSITLKISGKEKAMVEPICRELGTKTPTHVMDLYKTRDGGFDSVRIWMFLDLGVLRIEDLFVTDAYNEVIHDIDTILRTYQFENEYQELGEVFKKYECEGC